MVDPGRPDEAERIRSLARLLDSAFRIPGTSVRVGVDSIVGLVPGIGDLTGAALSGYIVLSAARIGAPPVVLMRMLVNLAVDTIVGAVPLLGDLFDVSFRANMRNADLLDRHVADPTSARKSSRAGVAVAVVGVALLAAGALAMAFLLVKGLNWLAGAG